MLSGEPEKESVVNCRTGSLEIRIERHRLLKKVNCRTGSLESLKTGLSLAF